MNKESGFSSKVGVVLATAGSAVGLGNIWKFSYILGQDGGGAFLVMYIICVFLLGMPLILSEFILGKHTHKNIVEALAIE